MSDDIKNQTAKSAIGQPDLEAERVALCSRLIAYSDEPDQAPNLARDLREAEAAITILADAASPADNSHRASYLAELHKLVGELITRPPGNEWVAVDRDAFDKLRRMHAGDAP